MEAHGTSWLCSPAVAALLVRGVSTAPWMHGADAAEGPSNALSISRPIAITMIKPTLSCLSAVSCYLHRSRSRSPAARRQRRRPTQWDVLPEGGVVPNLAAVPPSQVGRPVSHAMQFLVLGAT